MWRYHWGWWLWNASGKKQRSSFEKIRQNAVIFSFSILCFLVEELFFASCVFFFKSVTEPRRTFSTRMLTAAEKAFEGAFDALPGPGSRPLSLSCSLCRPCSLYADRLAHSAFHLLFASSCRKLTVDMHTWPASGHSMARIDRWSTGKGMVLTACQSTI